MDLGRIVLWVAIGMAAVVAVLLWRWFARRRLGSTFGLREVEALAAPSTDSVSEPEPEPEAPVLRSGIEQALRLLNEEREPADAVIRAWLGLQRTAAESGIVRRAAETPTEFTTRITSRVFVDDRAIKTLLALYLRTRFGDHRVTAAEVAKVRIALQGLARSWNAAAGSTTPGARHG